MSKPKIAITHEFLNCLGGAEKVLIQFHQLYPDAPIYCLLYDKNFVKKYLPNAKIIGSSLNKWPSTITKRHQLFLNNFPIEVEQFDFSNFDIVLSSCNSFIKGIITKPDTIHISYNHSPTRYFWDQTHEWIDQKRLGLFRRIIEWRFNSLRKWDVLAADRVDLFVANSKYVAKRIEKYYHRPSLVIYPPVDTDTLGRNQYRKKQYFLTYCRLAPFKRIDLAVKAFNQLGLPLIVAGAGEEYDYLRSIAKKNISFLGFVPDEKKPELLGSAQALIFPGEEDFGIIPVEAMASGTPIIAYKKGGLLESVIDQETGTFFSDQNEKSIIEAILDFNKIKSKINPQNCRRQAKKFSEKVFVQKIDDLVQYCFQNKNKIIQSSIQGNLPIFKNSKQ